MLLEQVCKVCGKLKSIKNYYKTPNIKSGYYSTCKLCFIKKQKSNKEERTLVEKGDYELSRIADMKLGQPNPDDYIELGQILTRLGYNITEDISKQFCAKYDLKYEPRTEENQYLLDGSKNPKYKRITNYDAS
jgi:hypothetical protein